MNILLVRARWSRILVLERAALVDVEFGEEDIVHARLRENPPGWHRVVPLCSSSLQHVRVGVEVGPSGELCRRQRRPEEFQSRRTLSFASASRELLPRSSGWRRERAASRSTRTRALLISAEFGDGNRGEVVDDAPSLLATDCSP